MPFCSRVAKNLSGRVNSCFQTDKLKALFPYEDCPNQVIIICVFSVKVPMPPYGKTFGNIPTCTVWELESTIFMFRLGWKTQYRTAGRSQCVLELTLTHAYICFSDKIWVQWCLIIQDNYTICTGICFSDLERYLSPVLLSSLLFCDFLPTVPGIPSLALVPEVYVLLRSGRVWCYTHHALGSPQWWNVIRYCSGKTNLTFSPIFSLHGNVLFWASCRPSNNLITVKPPIDVHGRLREVWP